MSMPLSAEQHELVAVARKLLAGPAGSLPPSGEARDAGADRALWRSLGELGLLGLGVAEDRGGSGGGMRELCLVAEQVGIAVARIPFSGAAAVLAFDHEHADAVARGSVLAVPAWETFPVVPGRRAAALELTGSTVDGELRSVGFGMDADLVLAFAGDTPVLVDLAGPGVARSPREAFDVTEPVANIRLTRAAATVLAPVEFASRTFTVVAAELVGTGAASPRRGRRVREAAPPVRPCHRLVPSDQAPARRSPRATRRHPAARGTRRRSDRRGALRRRALRAHRTRGGHRGRPAHGRRRAPGARRNRLHLGTPVPRLPQTHPGAPVAVRLAGPATRLARRSPVRRADRRLSP